AVFTVTSMCHCLFFFSSRRRHTRSKRDWSSDVCSSDLAVLDADQEDVFKLQPLGAVQRHERDGLGGLVHRVDVCDERDVLQKVRSEERRVGEQEGARVLSCLSGHNGSYAKASTWQGSMR